MKTIYFIEDDELLANMISIGLTNNGFHVIIKTDLHNFHEQMKKLQPDVLLLDLDINGKNSADILPYVRTYFPTISIIIASASIKGDIINQLISQWADYYIKKPYDSTELIAVINKLQPTNKESIKIGSFIFQPRLRILKHSDGTSEILNPTDNQLLLLFITSPTHKLSRDEILRKIWNNNLYENSLNNSICRLRQHLKKDNNIQIRTLWKGGYELINIDSKD